ncbi:Cyclic nucleotide-gated ion channel 18 [Bienertia sinuspersici]
MASLGHTSSAIQCNVAAKWLGINLAVITTALDFIFFCGTILKYRTTYMPAKFEVFERHIFIGKEYTYSKSSFIIDLLAILPIPQVLVGFKIEGLFWWIVVRFYFKAAALWVTLHKTMITRSILMKNAWLGALQNLVYFIVLSNAIGAMYYDVYISMLQRCHDGLDKKENVAATLDWDELIKRCTEIYDIEYGMFSDAFTNKIGTRSFLQKYTYCLAWGLKSLSGSSYPTDTIICFSIVIFGLVLFGDLLAKMQTALQCTEVKEDRQRTRQRMVEEWMKYHQLPQPLKKKVTQAIQSEWSATRGIHDETILDSLPWDTRSDIRRHLYLEIIRTMPLFKKMDEDLLNALCGYLRTFSSNKGTFVAFEGEPVRQMLFIFSGQLEALNTNNGGQCVIFGPGDLCGKELLEWCSHPTTSTENIVPATQTIKCITDVDAFALRVDDVKLLAIQFHRNGKFRCAFQRYAT